MKDTLLGPKRLWNKPIALRSKSVKNATVNKINRQWINQVSNIIKEYLVRMFLVLKTNVLY